MEICAPNAATGRESTGAKIPERQTIKKQSEKLKKSRKNGCLFTGIIITNQTYERGKLNHELK